MRKVQHFIVKEKEIFVGLEDSKRTWKVCVRSNGRVVHKTGMPADYEVLRNFFHNKFPACTITVIYEAGFRGFGLYDHLVNDGWSCIVTPPHTVTDEKCSRRKNDSIDCGRLAKNLENNDYKTCYVPDKQLREDRQLSRLYGQIKKDIIRTRNRIRRTLEFHGLDEQFTPGSWNKGHYLKLIGMLDTLGLSASLHYSLTTMCNQLLYLWESRKKVLKELRLLAKNERYKETVNLLKSAPGVGLLTAIRLALEWGDVGRFNRKEEFASFLGLIPSEHSSGEQERLGHITKQGNRSVRGWLVECSWVAIRYDPILLDKYERVVRSSGSKKKAIVAVARKLAMRLRAILLTRTEYAPGTIE